MSAIPAAEISPPSVRAAPRHIATRRQSAGEGLIEWQQVGGRTVVTRRQATSPLKLLSPSSGSKSSWIIAGTYGGGLLAGDRIELCAAAGPGTTCFLGTQASTKVYRAAAGAVSRQSLRATIAEGAICVSAPDPVTPFAHSRFEQRQCFDLSPGGGLVLVDWMTSGRRAAGERWSFAKYESRIDVYQSDRLVFRDALSLDPADGPLDASQRMGRVDCIGLVLVLGQPLRDVAIRLVEQTSAEPVRPNAPLFFSASRVAGGVVLRIAGHSAQTVGQWIRLRLDFVVPLLGADPWARKY